MSQLLKQSLLILKIFGDNHKSNSYAYRALNLFSMLNCMTVLSLLIEHLVTKWDGVRTIGELSDTFTTTYQIIWKFIYKALHRKSIAKCMETIKSFSTYNTSPESELYSMIQTLHEQSSQFFNVYRNVVVVAAVMYVSKPALLHQRILPGCLAFHCDLQQDWCYVITYAYSIIMTFVVIFYALGYDGLFFSFISYAYVELEAIKFRLLHLKINENCDGDDKEVIEELSTLVKLHDTVLRFLDEVNTSYQSALLQQFLSAIVAICCSIFILNLEGLPIQIAEAGKYVPLLTAFHLQLLMYCLAGELLMTQASSIADAAYNSKWYVKHQPKLGKGLIMIMLRTTRLQKLKIGGIWDMNLPTFVAVVKTSMSVLAFMQTLYEFE